MLLLFAPKLGTPAGPALAKGCRTLPGEKTRPIPGPGARRLLEMGNGARVGHPLPPRGHLARARGHPLGDLHREGRQEGPEKDGGLGLSLSYGWTLPCPQGVALGDKPLRPCSRPAAGA